MAKTSTSFKRGQSGNPHGRPKKEQAISEFLRDFLNKKVTNERTGEKITRKELFVRRIFDSAMRGDTSAARLIWNYVDGPPKEQPIQEVDTNDEILLMLRKLHAANHDAVKKNLLKRLS